MRTITIRDKKYEEDESYPLWMVIKRLKDMGDGISIVLVMAASHKEAMEEAERTWPEGEIVYVASMWNLFERLEFMVEK